MIKKFCKCNCSSKRDRKSDKERDELYKRIENLKNSKNEEAEWNKIKAEIREKNKDKPKGFFR